MGVGHPQWATGCMTPSTSNCLSWSSTLSLRAYGTVLALQNRGVSLGSTTILLAGPVYVPSSPLNTIFCFSKIPSSLEPVPRKICCQSNLYIWLAQPISAQEVAAFPVYYQQGNCTVESLAFFLTLTLISPFKGIDSPVYVLSFLPVRRGGVCPLLTKLSVMYSLRSKIQTPLYPNPFVVFVRWLRLSPR